MDSPLMQMQVVPGYDNVFYYTFKNPGTYTIRCLEYCGWNTSIYGVSNNCSNF